MKRFLSFFSAIALAAAASFALAIPASASDCPTVAMNGQPLDPARWAPGWCVSSWAGQFDAAAPVAPETPAEPDPISPTDPVDPVDPTPVDPVEPIDPDPVCTIVPGAPIYEDQVVGYENGAPIYERRAQYRYVFGFPVFAGYENVLVGYQQVPVYGPVQVGTEPDEEVCEAA